MNELASAINARWWKPPHLHFAGSPQGRVAFASAARAEMNRLSCNLLTVGRTMTILPPVLAMLLAFTGCAYQPSYMAPSDGPPLTSAAGIAAERATLAAAGGATHQLVFAGAGMSPEDRVPVFASQAALDRVFALEADEQEQVKIEMALGSFACWPRAGSPVRLVRKKIHGKCCLDRGDCRRSSGMHRHRQARCTGGPQVSR